MNRKVKKNLSFSLKVGLIFIILFFGSAGFVSALEINYPRVPGATPPQDFLQSASPEQIPALYVKYIFNLILWISGIIVLGVLIWAGIRYVMSAGNPEAILAAREQITNAFLGILILLSAFIILNILNPQLVILSVPKTEPIIVIETPEIAPPPVEATSTSIDAELLLGGVIEQRLFASSTMRAIKDNASTTLDIANALKKQNDDLRNTVFRCNCGEAMPVVCSGCECCGGSCNCDVCKNERGKIEDIEKNNLTKLDELKKEQARSIALVKTLKAELGKLEMLKKLMETCPLSALNSLANFFSEMVSFKEQGWVLRQAKVWDIIDIIYYDEELKQKVYDWATFYCPVSGLVPPLLEPPAVVGTPMTETPEQVLSLACKSEVPVGEIIDRAERIAKLLIKRLETLIDLDREMIEAVDTMHVLVSMCTSQDPKCCTHCYIIPSFPPQCVCECIPCAACGGSGNACPYAQIDEQAKKITEVQNKIQVVITEESKDNIGILPLIDKVIMKLLEDLDNVIRTEMSTCISETSEAEVGYLASCDMSIGGIEPNKLCCNNAEIKGFEACLENCYLEEGEKKYKKCLQDCLNTKAEPVKWCNHYMNFYCCHPGLKSE